MDKKVKITKNKFNEEYKKLLSSTKETNSKKYLHQHKKRIWNTIELIGDLEDKHILDVGASPLILEYFYPDSRFTTTDYSESYLQDQLEIPHTSIEKYMWRLEEDAPPFKVKARFDYIFFTEVLEHLAVKKPETILNETFYSLLKKNGKIIITTPNVATITNVIFLLMGKNIYWPMDTFYGDLDRHNREFTLKELYRLVDLNKYKVLRKGYMDNFQFGYCPQLYGKTIFVSNILMDRAIYYAGGTLLMLLKALAPGFKDNLYIILQKRS